VLVNTPTPEICVLPIALAGAAATDVTLTNNIKASRTLTISLREMDMSFSLWMFNEWVNRALHGYRPNVLAIDKVGVVLIIFLSWFSGVAG
jgi:hypothetical protein